MDGQGQKSANGATSETRALSDTIERQTASPSPSASDATSPASIAQSALDHLESQEIAWETASPPPASSSTNTNGSESQDGNSSSSPSNHPSQSVSTASTPSKERCERCIRQRKGCDGAKPACSNCAKSQTHRNNCVYPPGRPSRRQLAEMQNNQPGRDATGGHQSTNPSSNNGGISPPINLNNTAPVPTLQSLQAQQRATARQATSPTLVTPERPPAQTPTISPSVLHTPGLQMRNQRSIHSQPPPRWQPIDANTQVGRRSRSPQYHPTTTGQAPSPFTAYGSMGQGQDIYLRPRLFGDRGGHASNAVGLQGGTRTAPAFETAGGQDQTGQYPTRFPDLNWGPHHAYLADGTLNPSPPHGACTSPTQLGRTRPPVPGSLGGAVEQNLPQPPREEENARQELQQDGGASNASESEEADDSNDEDWIDMDSGAG
ncbi:hypothetical protein PV11_08497 [Exophiala sideris]|uniref:Zn(2)-C6 fungal-type domain-containing protein n=1 Tax=Exophiala sideris TaxID=1016849 RepID=A0A0D1YJ82_9EURO|nr:hypothetical protein PV11_08497 [Exophiala sideris]